MNRHFNFKGIHFYIGNYTPRRNEFERGLKYELYIIEPLQGSMYPLYTISTGYKFETIKQAKKYAVENYFCWL